MSPVRVPDFMAVDRPPAHPYNPRREPFEGMREMKLKKILLFALGVAVVVAGVLALNKRQR